MKWSHNGFFLIFWIFLLLFWNFLLPFGKERNGTITFIFSFSLAFPTYFRLKISHNDIFEFFFAIFVEFYLTPRPGTKQNDNFYSLSFSALPTYFAMKWSHYGFFLIFWIFLLFFGNFLLPFGKERNGTIILFSLFLGLFQPSLSWNDALWYFLTFWIFLLFFCNFLLCVRFEENGTIIFIFSLSLHFPTNFG